MSQIPNVQHEPVDDQRHVDDDMVRYRVMKQTSESLYAIETSEWLYAIEKDRMRTLPMPTSKEVVEAQKTET